MAAFSPRAGFLFRNVSDLRRLAKRRVPRVVFDFLDGGADDEWSVRNNTAAFDRYQLLPKTLVDISSVETAVSILGCRLKLPLILSPIGAMRLFHRDKELGVARAAERAGVMFSLGALSTTAIEDVVTASNSPKLYQIYIHKDRGLTLEQLQRCQAAKFSALCLTVDTPLAGNRERIKFATLQMPPRLSSFEMWAACLTRPKWGLEFIWDPEFRLANIEKGLDETARTKIGIPLNLHALYDNTVAWKDAEWLVKHWNGPFVIKGILTAQDARAAVDSGATAIMISNHGGRQLDGTPAPVDCIRSIRDAVGSSLEIIVDGGIRRASHIAKAMALGANACAIGRPQAYALAAGGFPAVDALLQDFSDEFIRTLSLLGCTSPADLNLGTITPLNTL